MITWATPKSLTSVNPEISADAAATAPKASGKSRCVKIRFEASLKTRSNPKLINVHDPAMSARSRRRFCGPVCPTGCEVKSGYQGFLGLTSYVSDGLIFAVDGECNLVTIYTAISRNCSLQGLAKKDQGLRFHERPIPATAIL